MDAFWEGFEKRAYLVVDPGIVGAAGGVTTGFYQGRQLSQNTANALSDHGYKVTNEGLARNLGTITAPLGALIGVGLGMKYKHKLLSYVQKKSSEPTVHMLAEGILPFASGALGGMTAGAATGALVSLRGKKFGKGEEKNAATLL